ncbi:MAG: septum formation protein Maf [Clostridia bacterium]|nr:septum formation protein Maf [Clostridia bacterium]
MTKIYLASASPRRKEILELLKLDFQIMTAPANEEFDAALGMEAAGETLAARKALALKEKLVASGAFDKETLIIAADTLVWCGGERLGKPKDAADALEMLCKLSGKTHQVCTGTCIIYGGRSISASEVSDVKMRAFSHDEAVAYVATKEPLDKAGAYAVQGIGSVLIDRIEGDFFSVMGLSPKTVCRLLKMFDISYFDLLHGADYEI